MQTPLCEWRTAFENARPCPFSPLCFFAALPSGQCLFTLSRVGLKPKGLQPLVVRATSAEVFLG